MTVAASQDSVITPEELLHIPDNGNLELVGGRIVEKKPVGGLSSATEVVVIAVLWSRLKDVDIFTQTLGYRCFPDDASRIRKPDVSVMKTARTASQRNGKDFSYSTIAPDLAIEVTSPNDVAHEINEKLEDYRKAKFPVVWQIDPEARTVMVYALDQNPRSFFGEEELTLPNIDPSFRCKAREFFTSPIKPNI